MLFLTFYLKCIFFRPLPVRNCPLRPKATDVVSFGGAGIQLYSVIYLNKRLLS